MNSIYFFTGRYIYLEASDYGAGDAAVLTSYAIGAGIATCVQFWYHMKGKDVGSLNVVILKNDSRIIVWSQTGQQGADWLFGQVGYKDVFNSYKVWVSLLLFTVSKGISVICSFCSSVIMFSLEYKFTPMN